MSFVWTLPFIFFEVQLSIIEVPRPNYHSLSLCCFFFLFLYAL